MASFVICIIRQILFGW